LIEVLESCRDLVLVWLSSAILLDCSVVERQVQSNVCEADGVAATAEDVDADDGDDDDDDVHCAALLLSTKINFNRIKH